MKRLVLVGAGHAHLYTLKHSAELTRHGIEVVLVAPQPFWYSGLATGMLGGIYEPALDRIDPGKYLAQDGGRWERDTVTAIHPTANSLTLSGGGSLSYDVLSLNLGSEGEVIPGSHEYVIEMKPIANLARLRERLEAAGKPMTIAVVGAGASGCELAANLRALQMRMGVGGQVVLLGARSEVLPRGRPAVQRKLRCFLESRGVDVRINARVDRVADQELKLSDGRNVGFDFAINASGLRPPPLLGASGLAVDADGAMRVDGCLRAISAPNIFGGGDCISVEGHSLDKVGVYAIRESPVLFANIRATLLGRTDALTAFRAQKRYLLILNLGDGTGLATWGGLHWHSRIAFWWKDYLDRQFLAEYR